MGASPDRGLVDAGLHRRFLNVGGSIHAGTQQPVGNAPFESRHIEFAHAARTMFTACISSDVSITTMGVDELMSTFRRSSPSVMIEATEQRLTGRECSPIIRNSDPPEYLSAHTKVTNQLWQIIFRR